MNTNWNQHCTDRPLRLESQHDKQRESYEDAVEAEIVSREEAFAATEEPWCARALRKTGARGLVGGGLGSPHDRDACDEDEGSW